MPTLPESCESIEDTIVRFKGHRILGLDGCMRYRPKESYQYTKQNML